MGWGRLQHTGTPSPYEMEMMGDRCGGDGSRDGGVRPRKRPRLHPDPVITSTCDMGDLEEGECAEEPPVAPGNAMQRVRANRSTFTKHQRVRRRLANVFDEQARLRRRLGALEGANSANAAEGTGVGGLLPSRAQKQSARKHAAEKRARARKALTSPPAVPTPPAVMHASCDQGLIAMAVDLAAAAAVRARIHGRL